MDLDFRTVMIAIGALLILAVLVHGAVQFWRERRRNFHFKDKSESENLTREEVDKILRGEDIIGQPRPARSTNIEVPVVHQEKVGLTTKDSSTKTSDESSKVSRTQPHRSLRPRKPPKQQSQIAKLDVTKRKAKRKKDQAANLIDPDEIVYMLVLGSSERAVGGEQVGQLMYEHNLTVEQVDEDAQNGWIFRSKDPETERVKFQVGQSLYPGSFPTSDLSTLRTEGLLLMMQLNNESDSLLSTFDEMLALAEDAKKKLNAQLVDNDRNRMTDQTTAHLRRRVAEVSRKQLMSAG